MKVVVFKAMLQKKKNDNEEEHWYKRNSLMKHSNYSLLEEDLSDCNFILFDKKIIRKPQYSSILTPPNEIDDE